MDLLDLLVGVLPNLLDGFIPYLTQSLWGGAGLATVISVAVGWVNRDNLKIEKFTS